MEIHKFLLTPMAEGGLAGRQQTIEMTTYFIKFIYQRAGFKKTITSYSFVKLHLNATTDQILVLINKHVLKT